MEGERINCWLRGREFYVTREFIQELLEVHPPTQQSYIHYDDRLDSLVPSVEILGGDLKKKALNTISFTPKDEDIGLHYALQPLSSEELDHLVKTKSHFPA